MLKEFFNLIEVYLVFPSVYYFRCFLYESKIDPIPKCFNAILLLLFFCHDSPILANPPGIPGLPKDLTYDPGIYIRLISLILAGLFCEFVSYEVNNY